MTRLLLTPHYASPEQKRGEGPSIAGDVYSLGRLLDDIVSREEAGRDLRAISERCQADEPAARYQSVGALLEDLRRYREGFPVRARDASAFYALTRFVRRQWAVVTLSVMLAVALVTGWWMSHQSAERANRSAGQFRALATQLIDDGNGSVPKPGEQVMGSERSLRRLIAELEKDGGVSSHRDLSRAWGRLGAMLCLRGDFPAGLQALQKATGHADQWRRHEPSAEANGAYVLHLISRVGYLQQQGKLAESRKEARTALEEFDRLPAPARKWLEGAYALQTVRLLNAFPVDGSPINSESIALLNSVIDALRPSGSGRILDAALGGLVRFYRSHGQLEQADRLCHLAGDWLVPPYSVAARCPEYSALEAEDLRDVVAAQAVVQIRVLTRVLRENPHSFWSRLELARPCHAGNAVWEPGPSRSGSGGFA